MTDMGMPFRNSPEHYDIVKRQANFELSLMIARIAHEIAGGEEDGLFLYDAFLSGTPHYLKHDLERIVAPLVEAKNALKSVSSDKRIKKEAA